MPGKDLGAVVEVLTFWLVLDWQQGLYPLEVVGRLIPQILPLFSLKVAMANSSISKVHQAKIPLPVKSLLVVGSLQLEADQFVCKADRLLL
eukprot:gene4093-2916_t